MNPADIDPVMLHAITLSLQDENDTIQKRLNRFEAIHLSEHTLIKTYVELLGELLEVFPNLETSNFTKQRIFGLLVESRKTLTNNIKVLNEPLWPGKLQIETPVRPPPAPATPITPELDNVTDDDIIAQINKLRMR